MEGKGIFASYDGNYIYVYILKHDMEDRSNNKTEQWQFINQNAQTTKVNVM